MVTIKLTSKRQATFPAQVCKDLGVQAGDELALIPQIRKGKTVWALAPKETANRPWAGQLKDYAKHAQGDHSMEAIRKSIAAGRK
ncbi:MAG: AbrB/MazE/SpoVT family DNA-binding domain-containing protein [Verrucomicrobiota bacterium]